MCDYLNLPSGSASVADLGGFDADRVFNLIGTNPADYSVAKGLSSWAVGEASDGLVRMENAKTFCTRQGVRIDSPNAYVHRSHSGYYGIVNSEEGYQNLTRFLFGSVRADGFLDILDVDLPDDVEQERARGRRIRASYHFEVVAALRGSQWQLHRRIVRENSAIQRTYDELFPQGAGGGQPARAASTVRSPRLFSIFLDPGKSQRAGHSIAFSFDITALVPDYEIDGALWLKSHFEGSYLVRRLIILEAVADTGQPSGWSIRYGLQNDALLSNMTPLAPTGAGTDALEVAIPIESPAGAKPGMKARLRIILKNWK